MLIFSNVFFFHFLYFPDVFASALPGIKLIQSISGEKRKGYFVSSFFLPTGAVFDFCLPGVCAHEVERILLAVDSYELFVLPLHVFVRFSVKFRGER